MLGAFGAALRVQARGVSLTGPGAVLYCVERLLQGGFAWLGPGLFGIWLTLRLWSVQGRVWLLPRALRPQEWLAVAAGFGLLVFQLYRAWRRRAVPRPVTDSVLVPFVRFWHGWRETRVTEYSVRLEGLDWTIRVNPADRPLPEPGPPDFTLDPVPRCPECGLAVTEQLMGRTWLRSCASAACNWRELSREPRWRTVAFVTRAARAAWLASRPRPDRARGR